MRKTNSYYKEDEEFDFIQKTKRNSKFSIKMSYTGEYNSMSNLKSSNISQASNYLSGLVNEIKESIVNIDDDIFSDFKSQNNKNSNTPKYQFNNYNIETNRSQKKYKEDITNRSFSSIYSPVNNLNNNNINHNFNLDNKFKIRKFVSYKKEFLRKKKKRIP